MNKALILKSLLILVILGVIVGAGYYVKSLHDSTNKLIALTNNETANIQPAKSKLPPLSATDSWTLYSNQEGSFSLKYPNAWQIAKTGKTCPSGTFDRSIYLGPDKNSVLTCPKNLISQVYISSLLGNQVDKYKFSESNFTNIKTQNVTVDKVKGLKESALTLSQPYPKNTFIERYILFNGSNTYLAQYIKYPSGPNYSQSVQLDFESIIGRTLTFQSD